MLRSTGEATTSVEGSTTACSGAVTTSGWVRVFRLVGSDVAAGGSSVPGRPWVCAVTLLGGRGSTAPLPIGVAGASAPGWTAESAPTGSANPDARSGRDVAGCEETGPVPVAIDDVCRGVPVASSTAEPPPLTEVAGRMVAASKSGTVADAGGPPDVVSLRWVADAVTDACRDSLGGAPGSCRVCVARTTGSSAVIRAGCVPVA